MNHRIIHLLAVPLIATLCLAACGDDESDVNVPTQDTEDTAPPTTIIAPPSTPAVSVDTVVPPNTAAGQGAGTGGGNPSDGDPEVDTEEGGEGTETDSDSGDGNTGISAP